jgi:hypothetical protein
VRWLGCQLAKFEHWARTRPSVGEVGSLLAKLADLSVGEVVRLSDRLAKFYR